MRTHFFVPTPTHTALQPIRTAHAPRWVTLHRYPSKPAAFSSHLMTAGADAQPSGRKPANMPYAEPLQGSTTCNPEGFFSPLPKRMMNEARTLPAEAERAAAISWTGCQPTEIKNTRTWVYRQLATIKNTRTWAYRQLATIKNTRTWAYRQLATIKNTGTWAYRQLATIKNTRTWAYRQNASWGRKIFRPLQIPADYEHSSSFTNHF